MKPIFPMEPKSIKTIPEGNDWIAQIKWDGVRLLTYYDGNKIELYNRKTHLRTFHYPELIPIKNYCSASSVILDGEVIALGEDGKPSFHQVMRRDGIRRMERVESVRKVVPITYMIFDVLYWNGQSVTNRPLTERQRILADILIPGDDVQLVSSHRDAATLFEVVEKQGMEGIVLKREDSPYLVGEKKDYWLKLKNYSDVVAVIGGYTTRDGIANAILLGLYDTEGQLWYIGHSGTGKWSKQEWRELTVRLHSLHQKEKPFTNTPERLNNTFWVKPELTVKVQFMEWTPGRSLRQPSIQALSTLNPDDCRFEEA